MCPQMLVMLQDYIIKPRCAYCGYNNYACMSSHLVNGCLPPDLMITKTLKNLWWDASRTFFCFHPTRALFSVRAFTGCTSTISSNLFNSILLIHNHISRHYSSSVVENNLVVIQAALMPIHAIIPLRRLYHMTELEIIRRCNDLLVSWEYITPQYCPKSMGTTCVFVTLGRVRGKVNPHTKPHPSRNVACYELLVKSSTNNPTNPTAIIHTWNFSVHDVTRQSGTMKILLNVGRCSLLP